MPRIFEAPAMRDGDVRVERPFEGRERVHFHMTHATFLALVDLGCLAQMRLHLGGRAEGVYPLPRVVTEPEAAEDLRNTIALLDPEPSDDCVMAGCLQPVVSTERGFSVCQIHDDLLRGWDSLVA
jgi:hypothetical protein